MSEDRPSRLFYTGDGSRGFPGVPRRDLEERDIRRLSDARYREITGKGPDGKALYQKSRPADRKAEPAKRATPQNHTWKRNTAPVSDETPAEAVQEPAAGSQES